MSAIRTFGDRTSSSPWMSLAQTQELGNLGQGQRTGRGDRALIGEHCSPGQGREKRYLSRPHPGYQNISGSIPLAENGLASSYNMADMPRSRKTARAVCSAKPGAGPRPLGRYLSGGRGPLVTLGHVVRGTAANTAGGRRRDPTPGDRSPTPGYGSPASGDGSPRQQAALEAQLARYRARFGDLPDAEVR